MFIDHSDHSERKLDMLARVRQDSTTDMVTTRPEWALHLFPGVDRRPRFIEASSDNCGGTVTAHFEHSGHTESLRTSCSFHFDDLELHYQSLAARIVCQNCFLILLFSYGAAVSLSRYHCMWLDAVTDR